MYTVEIKTGANTSKYWASLEFTDKAGGVHRKQIGSERTASMNSNHLQAVIAALETLSRPCMLDIYCDSEYVTVPFQQGWIQNWEKHEWTNAKGRPVRNAEQWKRIRELLARHSARFYHMEGRR